MASQDLDRIDKNLLVQSGNARPSPNSLPHLNVSSMKRPLSEPPTSNSIQSCLAFYVPGRPGYIIPSHRTLLPLELAPAKLPRVKSAGFQIDVWLMWLDGHCRGPVIPLRVLQAFQRIQVVFWHLTNARSPHQTKTDRLGTRVSDDANKEMRYGLEKEEVRQGVTGYHGSGEQYIIMIKVALLRIRPESLFSWRNGVQETRANNCYESANKLCVHINISHLPQTHHTPLHHLRCVRSFPFTRSVHDDL
ncbi:uncharacterized protein ARMOST_11513 [Armillaria ostoyae]|uniref:Uncharacterized protein n=1 Tax=Armillaria ostoyae TaxID=47428 RepID=A0A284RHB9_ARMOS|nr:uncharacterized protein ARMOST_11513 [Armillaria ostoyae]